MWLAEYSVYSLLHQQFQRMNKTKIYSGRVRVTTALKLSCGLLLNLLVLGNVLGFEAH